MREALHHMALIKPILGEGDRAAELLAEAESHYLKTLKAFKRLRGQLGTEADMPDVWPAGSLVVLLDRSLTQLDFASSARGSDLIVRAGPAIRPVDDPSFVERSLTVEGLGLRPYAPAHLKARKSGGDIRLSWIRRTRIDGDIWADGDVPLGEAAERYRVRVLDGEVVVREVETAAPEFTYAAAAQAADAVVGPLRIEVAQVSDRFGPGEFARIEIDD